VFSGVGGVGVTGKRGKGEKGVRRKIQNVNKEPVDRARPHRKKGKGGNLHQPRVVARKPP